MSERGRLRSQRSSIAAPEKFTDDYFDQNPDKFCSIVSFVLKKQQDEPATWTRIDKIFGFPKNKGELTKEELSDYLPPQDRVREIMKKLEFTQFSELEVGVFGKWLAGNGGFFGLVEGDAIWKKSEGLAYVAFLRQFCLHNYRAADTLYAVSFEVVVEAITVLYNYEHAYNKEDLRVTRIRQLVMKNNFHKFSPNVEVLKAKGWWDNKVSPDQYDQLMKEVDLRLRSYFQKIGKDWAEKSVDDTTAEALKLTLNRNKEKRKNRDQNKLLRSSFMIKNNKTVTSASDQTTENNDSTNEADDDDDDNNDEVYPGSKQNNEGNSIASLANRTTNKSQNIQIDMETRGTEIEERIKLFQLNGNEALFGKEKPATKPSPAVIAVASPKTSESSSSLSSLDSPDSDSNSNLECPQDALNNSGSEQITAIHNKKRKISYEVPSIVAKKQPRFTQEDSDHDKVSSSVFEAGGITIKKEKDLCYLDQLSSQIPPQVIDLTLENKNPTSSTRTKKPGSNHNSDSDLVFETFKNQWEEQKYCDVTLTTTCGRKIKAHKNILSAKNAEFSRLFKDMFPGEKTIEIPGIKYKILKETVRFLYCGEIDTKFKLDVPNVGRLLAASVKFKITGLQNFSKDFLIKNLTSVENANYIAHLGESLGLDDLKTGAKEFVDMTQQIQSKYVNN